MNIAELLDDENRRRFAAPPEADALREAGALQETQLLEVRVDALRSRARLLFDCRGALQIETGNTAVLVAAGLEEFSWTASPSGPRTAWSVIDWEPRSAEGRWMLSVGFARSARLTLTARAAEFYVGHVPGCDEAPPDYMEADEATVRAGLPGWHSTFESVRATFLDDVAL